MNNALRLRTMRGASVLGQLAVALALCLWALGGAARAADQPVALIEELNGSLEPPLEAFSELQAGDSVRLVDGASMTFLHYPTCAEVTVAGGRLVMSEERYTLQGGKIVKVDRARCPKTVVLSQNRQVGGVLIRSGGGGAPKLGTRPDFIVAGPEAATIAMVRVRDGDRVIVETGLKGHAFQWPDSAPDLAPKSGSGKYVAEMLDGSGKVMQELEFNVKAGHRPPVTVVRIKPKS